MAQRLKDSGVFLKLCFLAYMHHHRHKHFWQQKPGGHISPYYHNIHTNDHGSFKNVVKCLNGYNKTSNSWHSWVFYIFVPSIATVIANTTYATTEELIISMMV